MEYTFLLYDRESRWTEMTEDEARREYGAYMAYTTALREAGIFVDGNRLDGAATATTVRVGADGKTAVLDGPYPDTKEQLGGYYVVAVDNLDDAIAWAARCPCAAHGTVEVRPVGAVAAPV